MLNFRFLYYLFISFVLLLPLNAENLGVFIVDENNIWQTNRVSQNVDERFGYIVCAGGYLGSPMISNDKNIVDKYLNNCSNPEKRGPSKLPIINVQNNYNTKTSGYRAYSFKLNGQQYFLCRGFLNSTAWCSSMAEQTAIGFANDIRRQEALLSSQTTMPAVPNPAPPSIDRQALIQEISQELIQMLNLQARQSLQKI